MQETLTYKTSFTEDNYTLVKQNTFFSKLYKTSWLGTTIDTKVGSKEYRFKRTGILFPVIIITDKQTSRKIAEVEVIYPNLGFNTKAVAVFGNGRRLQWEIQGLFNPRWKWTNQDMTLVSSTEVDSMFSRKGEIHITTNNEDADLLSVLGLYLRSSLSRKNAISIAFGLVFFLTFCLRLFL